MPVHDSGRPLADKETSVTFDNECHEPPRRGGGALAEIGQLFHPIFPERDAHLFGRTNRALR
ncbi:MAG TPA: hypothetical protein VF480_03030, partial [Verrucomicrobiae bacterium]